jgi:hypothetical protein
LRPAQPKTAPLNNQQRRAGRKAVPESAKGRYSPADCIGIKKDHIEGDPDSKKARAAQKAGGMKIYEGEIYAFALGAAISWALQSRWWAGQDAPIEASSDVCEKVRAKRPS